MNTPWIQQPLFAQEADRLAWVAAHAHANYLTSDGQPVFNDQADGLFVEDPNAPDAPLTPDSALPPDAPSLYDGLSMYENTVREPTAPALFTVGHYLDGHWLPSTDPMAYRQWALSSGHPLSAFCWPVCVPGPNGVPDPSNGFTGAPLFDAGGTWVGAPGVTPTLPAIKLLRWTPTIETDPRNAIFDAGTLYGGIQDYTVWVPSRWARAVIRDLHVAAAPAPIPPAPAPPPGGLAWLEALMAHFRAHFHERF